MNLDLPQIRHDADPVFTDAKSCAAWLQTLPLINVGPTHEKLLGELEALNAFDMPASERIKVLELVRDAVLFLQSEQARKYAGKAVPLSKQEREVFLQVLALWHALRQGWWHCLSDLEKGIGGASGQAALICQRCLWSAGLWIAENYKIYQDFGADEWRRLNQICAYAESAGLIKKSVSHPSQKSAPDIHCADTFVQIQLLALANPNEHAPRQQELIAQWIQRWTGKASLSGDAPQNTAGTPLCIDLAESAHASRTPKAGDNVRFLDTREIGKSLKRRIAALKQGESPESLGLGNTVTEGLAAQMLVMLHQQWCEDRTARQAQRRNVSGHAQVNGGMAAIHYFVSGRSFDAPGTVSALTPQQREHIETFGQLSTRRREDSTVSLGYSREQWRILDESLDGIRLERPRGAGQSRYLHRQLVAIRPADASSFCIGSVRWISVGENAVLRIGARIMPGVPRGVAVRLGGVNVQAEKLVQALMLPEMPALRSPATLIVPAGWFRPRRLIELQGSELQHGTNDQFLLTSVIERGSNFERCTFEPA